MALLLPDHHRRLETRCRALLACAQGDDPRELIASWRELEVELLDHMAAEEESVLPSYAKHAPEDAKQLAAEHVRLREIASALGLEVELHAVRIARLEKLVAALHAHGVHEDTAMYTWAQANLGEVAQHLLIARLGRWLGVATTLQTTTP
jgi:hypothetical protein